MERRATMALVVGLACWAGAGRAAAQTPAAARPVERTVTSQIGASINNAGLQHSWEAEWLKKTRRSSAAIMSDAHVSGGLQAAVTPAGLRAGGWIEVAPLSVLSLRGGVESASYFGTLHSLWSTGARTDVFDTGTRKAVDGAAGRTTRWYFTPALQARAGALVGRTAVDIERWSSTAAGPFYYEPLRDTLLAVGGDHLVNLSTLVAWEHRTSSGAILRAGALHGLMQREGADALRIQRVGAVVSRRPAARPGRSAPAVTLAIYRYLDHPYRDGQFGAALTASVGWARR